MIWRVQGGVRVSPWAWSSVETRIQMPMFLASDFEKESSAKADSNRLAFQIGLGRKVVQIMNEEPQPPSRLNQIRLF